MLVTFCQSLLLLKSGSEPLSQASGGVLEVPLAGGALLTGCLLDLPPMAFALKRPKCCEKLLNTKNTMLNDVDL